MKKWDGLVGKLTGLSATILVLSVFVSRSAASTDVVWVQPQGNTSGEFTSDGGYVAESFIATADTITTASFFCGKERPTGYYYGYINTSPSPGGTSAYGPSAGKKYQDIVFNFNVGVTRGQRYYFVVQHTGGGSPQGLEYYYREGTAYSWGSLYLSGTQDTTKDLCARAVGVNRTDSTYWGIHGSPQCDNPGWDPALKFAYIRMADSAGIRFFRLQVRWDDIQPHDSLTYHFSHLDPVIDSARTHHQKVLINIVYPPKWASSCPDSDTAHYYQYPPKNMLSQGDSNYLMVYLDTLVKHYKGKVFAYEIFNEVNLVGGWNYPRTDIAHGGYDTLVYPHTHQGRANLYTTVCLPLAYNTIKAIDTARVVASPVDHPAWDNLPSGAGIKGCVWLDYFYGYSGKIYSDVISYHFYPPPETPYGHRFSPAKFRTDYDTLRGVMSGHGDSQKPLWADEGGWGTPIYRDDLESVSRSKQADIIAQLAVTGIGQEVNPKGPLGTVMWFNLNDGMPADTDKNWYDWAGIVDGNANPKPSRYAYKQANTKLKGLYFNRQVPLGNPSDSVYCYEFQIPGSDTCRKTWVVWKTGNAVLESISVRTSRADSIKIAYSATPPPDSGRPFATSSGKLWFLCDSMPFYFTEVGGISRPDVIIDSLYILPSNPTAGTGINFFARIKNISTTAGLDSTLADSVTFQIDGVTQAKFKTSRGLGLPGSGTDTLTVRNPYPYFDWTANWGDHLIRAWVDSADHYVELREDNNQGYIFKHIPPGGYINIPGTSYPNGRKFSNTRPKNLSLVGNGGTSPAPTQMKIKNSWEANWRAWQSYVTSLWDTLPASDGLYNIQAEFKMDNGETSAIAIDSIVYDPTAPTAQITSPANGATVNGTVTFSGKAYDNGHFWMDTLKYYKDSSHHDTIHVSWTPVGGKNQTGILGTWNTTLVPNGSGYKETLAVRDSATNYSFYTITLTVSNNSTDRGSDFASNFGNTQSPTTNVVTDFSGNVYIAETQNSKVRKFSPHKDSVFAFSVKRGYDSTGVSWAAAMVPRDSTILYVADGYNHCIKKFDSQGNLLLRFGSFGQDTGKFRQPCGIALDSKGRLWVVDRLNNRIQVFDTTGHFLFKFGSLGTDSGKFFSPTGIAITRQDTLSGITQDLIWVSDTKNDRIQVFDSLGNWVQTISQVDSLGLDTPLGICTDKWGDVFIADSKHDRIVELNPFGQRILDFGGQGDSLCQFRTPVGVASSPGAQYLYVADMGNKRVQRFWVIQGDSTGGGPQTAGPPVKVIPKVYSLAQSHPNPTTGEAVIEYGLPKESPVNLTIYNVAGQAVRDYNPGKQEASFYTYKWDGKCNQGHKVGCGVYFYRLKAGNWVKTRKMVVVR